MFRIVLIFLFFSIFPNSIFAQKEANIWYFGNQAGIDFNSGTAVPLTDGQMLADEGCASIADSNGKLLFYTNGVYVWNKNHVIMPNGSGLMGNLSTSQSAIIVPKPNNKRYYYIFTQDVSDFVTNNGLRYNEVDMNLNGGLGDITALKNRRLRQYYCEKITAVQHANGKDYWVISHEVNSNAFHAFLVTATGVNETPVESYVGTSIDGSEKTPGYLKASPDGKHLALEISWDTPYPARLYDFDNATGIVSNEQTLAASYSLTGTYGVEFSTDSKLLYVCEARNNNLGYARILQYDLSASNILSSEKIIGKAYNNYVGALQLAPDGKLYIAFTNYPYLGVIHEPNNIGASCNFVENGFFLNGKESVLGLPNFIQSFFKSNFSYSNTCYKDSTQFKLTVSGLFDSLCWNFGDPLSGIQNTSVINNPKHVFTDSGSYTVRLIVFKGNLSDTTIKKIRITKVSVFLGKDTTLCSGNTILLNATQPNSTYEWKDASTNNSLNVTQSGQYWVKVTTNGCVGKDTLQITFLSTTTKNISVQICEGKQYTLPKGNIVKVSGTYKDTLKNSIGCDSIIITNLNFSPAPIINKSVTICSGNFYIRPKGKKEFISGIYKDTLQTAFGCDSIIISNLTVSLPSITQKSAHICTGSLYTLPSGRQVNSTGIYKDTIKTLGNCDSIILTNLTVHLINTTQQNAEICAGETYTLPNGIKINNAGNYTSIIKTNYNCDSIIKTQLSVISAKTTIIDTLACEVSSYKLPSGKLVTQNGTYIDSLKSNVGCDSIITTHLQLDKKPQLQLATDFILCIDSTLILKPIITNSTQYHWQDNSILPTYLVIQEGTYILTATNVCGETKQTTVVTNEDCSTCELYLPNAFSPNNDGINDEISPLGNCIYKNLSFKIFNRWNELVFETTSLAKGWNGNYKNAEEPIDNYVWTLEYTDTKNIKYNKKGILTLLR